MASQPPTPPKNRMRSMNQLAMVLELPFLMVASTLIAGGAGYLFDRWLRTSPVFTLILGFLGFCAGIWDMVRRLSRSDPS
jgi:F0F1-type ATP synthase assembly protein I